MNPDVNRPVVLIDLSALYRAAWHASGDEPASAAFEGTLSGVRRCAGKYAGALVAVCCDGKGNWRKKLSPEYKAHREKQPEAMYGLLDRVKERLRADAFLLWEFDGYEADDVIATATWCAGEAGHTDVVICSHDKDLLQLVGEGVVFLKTSTWEIMTESDVVTKFGVSPGSLGDLLALAGDSSDGIKGAPGIGPKTASELIKKYGSIDGINAALAKRTVGDFTPAKASALLESKEAVKLARELVTLKRDVPLHWPDIYERREMKPLTKKGDEMDNDGERFFRPAPGGLPHEFEEVDHSGTPIHVEPEKTPAEKIEAIGPGLATGVQLPGPISVAPPAPMAEKVEATALATVEYTKQLEPRSFKETMMLATYLYESRLFGQFPNREAIAAVIMRGREMGLGGATALSVFHVVEGRPCAFAYLIIARAKAHSDCEYLFCEDASVTSATWVTKNRKNPRETRCTFTIEQARSAGLIKPRGGWEKNPEDMLVKSAGVKLARREYPDAALGLYSVEEMGGE